MKDSYDDILRQIPAEPLWWDRHGTPRWREPTPENSSNVYADTVVFMDIACQGCGHEYLVELALSQIDRIDHEKQEFVEIDPTNLYYGDPPNGGCCAAGATMTSISRKVVSAHRKVNGEWIETHRDIEIEDDIEPLNVRGEWW